MELGETVTWRAKHLGVYQKLTVEITQFARPHMFEDVMLKGAFKRMRHVHTFELDETGTIMKDAFEFESPLGWLGKLADSIFLKRYMTKFLENKNRELKMVAEGAQWKNILKKSDMDEH
ncbi:MAG: SRPBCC family protein [Flavobacteriales bacterium]|nr:SRPBCC family protein [Flavobacteriales bacterium]